MLEETPEEREVFSAMEQSSVRKETIRQMDKYQSIMEELAVARMLIRELSDRLAKLEKAEPVALQYPQKDIDWQQEQQIKAQASIPPHRKPLTDEHISKLAVCGAFHGDAKTVTRVIEAAHGIKDKNT